LAPAEQISSSGLEEPPQLVPGYNICAIWQNSRETQRLIKASKKKATVVDRLEDLIAVLDNSNSTALSFKALADNMMSEHKKEGTQMKARYLA
jgi:hypothetical protein